MKATNMYPGRLSGGKIRSLTKLVPCMTVEGELFWSVVSVC
jgi:hypothetical protein